MSCLLPKVGKRVSGTVTREVLDDVFGPDLLAELEMYGKQAAEGSGGGLNGVKSDGSGAADGADGPDALSGKHGVAGKLQVTHVGRAVVRECVCLYHQARKERLRTLNLRVMFECLFPETVASRIAGVGEGGLYVIERVRGRDWCGWGRLAYPST